jgi:mannose-1-phosphate guanylyltransferase
MTLIQPKLIKKPWGYELWIADGIRTPYANKKIVFNAGNQTSMQVHQFKFETNYVLSGTGFLLISDKFFDVNNYLHGGIDKETVDEYISNLKCIPIMENSIFDVHPGYIHRVIATTELTFMETSTIELDDVVRLQDDTGRHNGRIDAEHK